MDQAEVEANLEMEEMQQRQQLIVGIDFGSTYTGVSFAMTEDECIVPIDVWPNFDRSTTKGSKTPTQIAYPLNQRARPWGYKVKPGIRPCAWMKYHLDKAGHPSPYDDPKLSQEIKNGLFSVLDERRVEDITVDYLKEILKYTIKKLEEVYEKEILDVTTIKFWLTKPAKWGDEAQIKLRRAVQAAAMKAKFYGIREEDDFGLISEPEAAAYATLADEGFEYQDVIENQTGILVLDCGGGTVDLSVYRVASISPRVTLKEVIPSQGGKCGASFLETRLDEFMTNRFGTAYTEINREHKVLGSDFMTDFEKNKRLFGGNEDLVPMKLHMKNVESTRYYKRDCEVILNNSDMEEIFRPVVGNIERMLSEQATAAFKLVRIQYLILVGGFGGSPYLRSRIQSWCDENQVTLKTPKNSWGAVAKGAVLHGLDRAVVERRLAQFHYGIPCSLPWNKYKDTLDERKWSEVTRNWVTHNCVSWHVKIGDEITGNFYRTSSFIRRLNNGATSFADSIVSSPREKPPRKSQAVLVVGQVLVRLNNIDIEQFRDTTPGRENMIRFRYQIEQRHGDKEGTLLFSAVSNEQTIGQGDITFWQPESGRYGLL